MLSIGSSSRSWYFYWKKVWRCLPINTQYASSECWSQGVWGNVCNICNFTWKLYYV